MGYQQLIQIILLGLRDRSNVPGMDRERPWLNLGKLLSCRHQLILEEIPDWNTVQLVVNGEMVFRCNINDLDFGGDGKLDPLCEEARKAVLNTY
ncbi:UPF0728 protein C10orf53 homolog [Buteo buteo]|uniref:UPF0728 protein C10orf53 homolog n=1 Tax=Buteo buteo TaxID=30397 RepID=UPI003EBF5061